MAVLTLLDIQNLALDRLVSNVAVDAPIVTAELNRAIDDAYSDLWEIGGASVKQSTHATLWTPSPATVGIFTLTGVVANFREMLRVFRSTTVGSIGLTLGDVELDRMEVSEIMFRRNSADLYDDTAGYAVEKWEPSAAADVGKINLHLWPPAKTTQYYPAHYVRDRTTISGATDKPDVTEGESRDIAYMAAIQLAPAVGRAELVPSLIAEVSAKTRNALDAKFRALLEPRRRELERTT